MKKLSGAIKTAILSSLGFLVAVACKEVVPASCISGSFYFAGTKIPAPGVTVDIDGKVSTSSADGSYLICDIPSGNYTLKAEKEGFDTFYIDVVITSVQKELDIPLTSQRFTSRVFGTLTGGNGVPLSGCAVSLLNPDGSESDLKTTTGSGGGYELLYVPHGERTIAARVKDEVVFETAISLADADYQLDISIPEDIALIDSRDGKIYKTGRIGSQTWMLENLAYLPSVNPSSSGSDSIRHYYVYGYEGSSSLDARQHMNYSTYGVLYNWPSALEACPEGWHLPGDEEWQSLEMFLGLSSSDAAETGWRESGDIGRRLKSSSGWLNDGSGDNTSGFKALPAGRRNFSGSFVYLGDNADFWTSNEEDDTIYAWYRGLSAGSDGIYRYYNCRKYGFSVRCLKNE